MLTAVSSQISNSQVYGQAGLGEGQNLHKQEQVLNQSAPWSVVAHMMQPVVGLSSSVSRGPVEAAFSTRSQGVHALMTGPGLRPRQRAGMWANKGGAVRLLFRNYLIAQDRWVATSCRSIVKVFEGAHGSCDRPFARRDGPVCCGKPSALLPCSREAGPPEPASSDAFPVDEGSWPNEGQPVRVPHTNCEPSMISTV